MKWIGRRKRIGRGCDFVSLGVAVNVSGGREACGAGGEAGEAEEEGAGLAHRLDGAAVGFGGARGVGGRVGLEEGVEFFDDGDDVIGGGGEVARREEAGDAAGAVVEVVHALGDGGSGEPGREGVDGGAVLEGDVGEGEIRVGQVGEDRVGVGRRENGYRMVDTDNIRY